MSNCHLFLIRHAQSENNAKAEAERVPDPAITQLGAEQAERLVPCLHRIEPDIVYCSPFLRTIQTLQPAAKSAGLTPIIHPEIFEQGGCYSGHLVGQRKPSPGMSRDEIAELCPDWSIHPDVSEQGWNRMTAYETITEARVRARRVRSWYESETEMHNARRVAMMIHADFKLRMLEAFLGIDDLEPYLTEPYNTSITWIVRTGGSWQLRLWNDHHHLPNSHLTV
ncbi:histidine phosphatase family protein [Pirellulaceae bacterium SH449]